MTTERFIDVTTEDLQRAIHHADKQPHTFDEVVAYTVLKLGFVALGGRRIRLKLPNNRHLIVSLEDAPAFESREPTVDAATCKHEWLWKNRQVPQCRLCGCYSMPKKSEWIVWRGGRDPIPDAKWFSVRFREGRERSFDRSSDLVWFHHNTDSDIVAYKVIE